MEQHKDALLVEDGIAVDKRRRNACSCLTCAGVATVCLAVFASIVISAQTQITAGNLQAECNRLRKDVLDLRREMRDLNEMEMDQGEDIFPFLPNFDLDQEYVDENAESDKGTPSSDVMRRAKRDAEERIRHASGKTTGVFHLEGRLPPLTESAKELLGKDQTVYLGDSDNGCRKMYAYKEAVRTMLRADGEDFDNVVRCWQTPSWIDTTLASSEYEYDPIKGEITVKKEGIYFLYSQIFYVSYVNLSQTFGHGIHINGANQAIFKCFAELEATSGMKHQTCYTGGVEYLMANATLSLRNSYNRSGRYLSMSPELSYWGVFRVQTIPGASSRHIPQGGSSSGNNPPPTPRPPKKGRRRRRRQPTRRRSQRQSVVGSGA